MAPPLLLQLLLFEEPPLPPLPPLPLLPAELLPEFDDLPCPAAACTTWELDNLTANKDRTIELLEVRDAVALSRYFSSSSSFRFGTA